MRQHFTISEYGIIRKVSDYALSERVQSLKQIFVSEADFISLKQLAFQTTMDVILSFFVQKGFESLRVKNHIGLLQTPTGTVIEILPKIATETSIEEAQLGLLKMLRCVPNLPFYSLGKVQMRQARLPLWELFVTVFIEEIEKITQQGIQKSYVTVAHEQPFLRGKLLLSRQKHTHSYRFFVASDKFQMDIVPNRLLKTCLLFLEKSSRLLTNQTRLRQLRFVWDEVGISKNIKNDFEQITHAGKAFERYQKALQWARVFLHQLSLHGVGSHANESLLFPAERLFEHYVARGFKKYLTHFEVYYQDNIHHLINDHTGKRRFGLRPDLVLRKNDSSLIIDIKWKWIEPSAPNLGIEQSDLYQLYAYGKKYRAKALFLIYPAHPRFQTPLLPFFYDDELKLTVVPFDITKSLADEMAKIENLIGLEDL